MFDSGFQDSVIWLLIYDLKFTRDWQDKIKPDMFTDAVRWDTASNALAFYAENHHIPKNLFRAYVSTKSKNKLVLEYLTKLEAMTAPATAFITQSLSNFFLSSSLSNVNVLLTDALKRKSLQEAVDVIKSAQRTILSPTGKMRPMDYFETIPQRTMRRDVIAAQSDGVHFMIPTFEKRGIYAHMGEITLILAPSKRGKSIALTHVSKCAVFMGHHVLYVSLENPIAMVEDRFDAMFSGISIQELRALSERLKSTLTSVKAMAKGRLHLLYRPARTYSPNDLRADIEQLRAEGIKIDTAVVDYGELMRPIGKYSGESGLRASRDDIFMHFRAVCNELNVAGITAQQTTLKKRKKFRLGMEDGQEASMPAQHSSLIITLNQTEDEQQQQEMRLYVDGYWHGPCGPAIGDILVKQDFDRMQFCITEIPLQDGIEAQKKVP